MKRFLALLITLSALGCARVQTLNLEPHEYSERPDHIIWIQVAGFSEEHIPLLRFNVAEATHKTNLEQVDCVGKMWNFNLYQLRPEASKSFLSQITGSKNIRGTCEDYTVVPSWQFLQDVGYSVSVLESGASVEQSLEKSLGCSNSKMIDLGKMRFYRMGPDIGSQKTFHYQDSPDQSKETVRPGLYYDRSCQKGICYSSLSNNFRTLWSMNSKDHRRSVFVVRDFNFQNALKKKDISLAKESLQEIDRIVSAIKSDKGDDLLVVVSGAESMMLEFPLQGKEWSDFEKAGKNLYFKNSSLMSPVLAKGSMAENFCGIFDESDMLKRMIYKPEDKKFNWDSVSPF
ncbi:hypothetical protein DOM21_17940 [Bacteriovorax stolpii]|uniref:Uncharacterized protein n=1 Tax=Bacteriovorax stolpii TaxID=960 RepID=A0A2K9NMM2_BACTC|nr:hypothetical protein [Bacteriovorax stolpii]AUN96766.1 hypothetical protein C0V70_01335 [Bacteriovorax stolpii]QDK43303.1 hypothetical protein DOM21_17940 [Bacteriovorax stolpii]TDP53042.1 hypothetical protein C8D79_1683 [Bacteriovorax stolpii]